MRNRADEALVTITSAAAEGIVEFENSAGYSQFPLVKDDVSVQFTTVISGPEAPTAYEYGIGDGDLTVEITPEGCAIFTDEEGNSPGRVFRKTIKQQYDCHTVFAGWKDPWNLERVRKTRDYWLINPGGCNW